MSGQVKMIARGQMLKVPDGMLFRGDRFYTPAADVYRRIECGESFEDTTVSGLGVGKALELAEQHGVLRITDLRLADLSALPLDSVERQSVQDWRDGVAAAPASPAAALVGLDLSAEVVAALAAMGLGELPTIAAMDRQALDRALSALPEGHAPEAEALLAWWTAQQTVETKPDATKPARKGKASK